MIKKSILYILNNIFFILLTIILSPVIIIYLLYNGYQSVKQRALWMEDWNNYQVPKPKRNNHDN